jgi:Fur family ferric uptake transcriptional regulator
MIRRDWDEVLRAYGYRITPQRQLVLEAVNTLGHATPEELCSEVQKKAAAVNLSTIYRTLEVLEQVGLVTHAHIGHGAPTYHSVETDAHIHLVCDTCQGVTSIDADVAEIFVQILRDKVGFETDVAHVSVHGQCTTCLDRQKLL